MSQQNSFTPPERNIYIKYHNAPSGENKIRSGIIERYTYKTDNGKLIRSTSNDSFKVSRTTIIKTNINKTSNAPTKHHVFHQNVSPQQSEENKIRTEHCDSTTDVDTDADYTKIINWFSKKFQDLEQQNNTQIVSNQSTSNYKVLNWLSNKYENLEQQNWFKRNDYEKLKMVSDSKVQRINPQILNISSESQDKHSLAIINAKYHSVLNNFTQKSPGKLSIPKTQITKSILESSPQKVQKICKQLSPESMKSEFYSYLKINTNPSIQKTEKVSQHRRSIRVKNLILQNERKREVKTCSIHKNLDIRKKFLKYSRFQLSFPPPPIQENKISDFGRTISEYFQKENINYCLDGKEENIKTKTNVETFQEKSKIIKKKKLLKDKDKNQFFGDKKLLRFRFRSTRILRNNTIIRNSVDGYKIRQKMRKAKLKAKMKAKKHQQIEQAKISKVDKNNELEQKIVIEEKELLENNEEKIVLSSCSSEDDKNLESLSEESDKEEDLDENQSEVIIINDNDALEEKHIVDDVKLFKNNEEIIECFSSSEEDKNVESSSEESDKDIQRINTNKKECNSPPFLGFNQEKIEKNSSEIEVTKVETKEDDFKKKSKLVNIEIINNDYPNFIPLDQNIKTKSFHKSLIKHFKKSVSENPRTNAFELSDSDSSISSSKLSKGCPSRRSQTHDININKNNGAIFNTYYINDTLIIVQELLISFWKQTALGKILGVQNMWLPYGNTQRIILDPGCVNRRSPEMISSVDNSVAYIELWTKEHKCVYRECPVADVFATIYYHKGYGLPDKKVLQLENIKGYGDDVRFTVITNAREIIVSWCDRTKTQPLMTLIRCYKLASDFQTVCSIKEMEGVSHYISSIHNIHDCDDLVLGAGNEQISLWNLRHGYLVTTLSLFDSSMKSISENSTICLYAKCDTGFLFVIQQTTDGNLRLIAVNGKTQEWKLLHSYHVPQNYKELLGVAVESGVLMNCYTNGFLCWNMHSGDVLAEIITPSELIVLPSNKHLISIDNYKITVHHIMSYILSRNW